MGCIESFVITEVRRLATRMEGITADVCTQCTNASQRKEKVLKVRCLWADNFIYFFSYATFNIFSFLTLFISHSADDKLVNYFRGHQSLLFQPHSVHKRMALSELKRNFFSIVVSSVCLPLKKRSFRFAPLSDRAFTRRTNKTR